MYFLSEKVIFFFKKMPYKKLQIKDFCCFFGCGLRGAGCGLIRAGKKACGPRAGGLRARPEYISRGGGGGGTVWGRDGFEQKIMKPSRAEPIAP